MADLPSTIIAIATPLAVILTWWEQRRTAKLKERRDDADRRAARADQLAGLKELADEQRATKHLVDGHNTAQTKELVAIKDVISKGQTPPEMPAEDAAPGQVTQDGGVVSVGKEEEKEP